MAATARSGAVARAGLAPLLLVSGVVVLVAFGQARGLWVSNLHNGLLGLAFSFVGAHVLFQRPGHHEGQLFLATGVVEAVMFFGRQIGHSTDSIAGRWWGWVGIWPVAVSLALTTLSVVCFPDGRLPAGYWRWIVATMMVITAACVLLSACWPVDDGWAGIVATHPINKAAPAAVTGVWSALAHPAYIGFQVLWLVAVVDRWRRSGVQVRRKLIWLLVAAAGSLVALAIGLIAWGTPTPGLLSATLVPVAAGWAIVHDQHVVAYSALSWLSRAGGRTGDLSGDLARAVAEALAAPGATLWMGTDELHPVGVWPETDEEIGSAAPAPLRDSPDWHVRLLTREDTIVGAITLDRPRSDQLSVAENRLFDDLAAQASLVISHIRLAEVISRQRQAGHLDGLSPRERVVLELIAAGRSNAAICEQLHLSVKTVEPVVSAIFTKLGLHANTGSNRRVLAALAYLRQ